MWPDCLLGVDPQPTDSRLSETIWDQIEKWQQGLLSSKYYLEDIKTIYQDYTQNMHHLHLTTY